MLLDPVAIMDEVELPMGKGGKLEGGVMLLVDDEVERGSFGMLVWLGPSPIEVDVDLVLTFPGLVIAVLEV